MQINIVLLFIISIRIVAMLLSSPVFSMSQIPGIVKVGLSLIIAYVVGITFNATAFIMPASMLELILVCTKEVFIGISIGFIATVIFNAVRNSAMLMDFSTGFSMSAYYDPTTAGSSTVLERLFNWIALMLFLTFNFHHVLIQAVIKSFEVVPPGLASFSTNAIPHLINVFAEGFLISIKLAAPIIIVLFLTDFVLGLISRTVPQIQVFILGMPIKILIGLAAITMILPGLSRIYIKTFEGISTNILHLFNAFPVLLLFASDDKTEEPTGKKLSDAKKKGQVPKSVDLNSAIILLSVMIVFSLYGNTLYKNARLFIIDSFKLLSINSMGIGDIMNLFIFMLKNILIAVLPIALTVLIIGVAANVFQTGFILTGEGLKPKFDKLNPISGFKKFFSKRAYVELLKNLAKIAFIAYITFNFIKSQISKILITSDLSVPGIFPFVKSITDSLLSKVVTATLIIGLIDFIFQRRQFKKDLRMTKQEVREEFKQQEGNPEIKSKIKQKQREISTRRMMQEIPKATVVITNPTHFAIALKYEKGTEAPMVIAKGADLVALKIKEIAKESNIPIVENKQLARTLFARVEINEVIPVELYQAVAEIVAYVYSMKKM